MSAFTVIGFYTDTRQRFMGAFEVETAEAAEDKAKRQNTSLCVCGVVRDEQTAADTARASIDE